MPIAFAAQTLEAMSEGWFSLLQNKGKLCEQVAKVNLAKAASNHLCLAVGIGTPI